MVSIFRKPSVWGIIAASEGSEDLLDFSNLHFLVSKIDIVSPGSLSQNEGGGDDDEDTLLCLQSHHHVTPPAFPALMKVFANLNIQCELIFAVKTAVLSSTRRSRDIPLKSDMKFDLSFVETTMFFLKKMMPHWPKTLKKVVFLSANMQGSGLRGSVFTGNQELGNFIDLISTSMVYESWLNWLNNPRNVTYWIKGLRNDEHSMLRENVLDSLWLSIPMGEGQIDYYRYSCEGKYCEGIIGCF
ncbi:hypothetical protein NC652_000094 [Populus alba x Populus x berolinensis]|nr:hypothetical protein NC652_000094 [Populus alba x Populus x berolinensis]